MKFCFVENRYKTIFWSALAKELRSMGCKTSWLIQNPVFAPIDEPLSTLFTVEFPCRTDLIDAYDIGLLEKTFRADRNINYFGGSAKHYGYYKKMIELWLDCEQPDIVVGESTLFHELITISICRDRGIPYLHPSMPGYPGGRYSIYIYDKKDTIEAHNQVPSDSECLAIAEIIRKRERVPDYMIPPNGNDPDRVYPLPRSIMDRLKILRGYIAGECYNTPSPWRKWLLDQQVRKRLKVWRDIAQAKLLVGNGLRLALYPLQMQPEANLDVWGQEFREQARLVKQIADALPNGWHLCVKANPKAKYELSNELMEVLYSHPKVSPIPLESSMSSVFTEVDMVCTVTGTVAVECVLSGKPLVQFGPSIVQHGPGCKQVNNVDDIYNIALDIEAGKYVLANEETRIGLIKKLYSTTYSGMVSDPINLPSVMRAQNITAVANGLYSVAHRLKLMRL